MTALPARAVTGPGSGPARPPATKDPYSPAYQHPYRKGAVPTRQRLAQMSSWARGNPGAGQSASDDLSYRGGIDGIGVTSGHEKVYLVFYGSQWGTQGTDGSGDVTLSGDPSGEAPYLQQLFKGLGTGGDAWSGVMTQYCDGVAAGSTSCPDGSTEHAAYPYGGALAGVWVDESSASPGGANGHQLGQEAVNAAAHFGNTTAAANRDAQYVIASPTGTSPDGFIASGFCAWHDYNGDTSLTGGPVSSPYGDVAFTNLPYTTDAGSACGQSFVNAGSAGTLDGVSIVAGHEYAETITDQNPAGGWTDPFGEETGDKCAWIAPGTAGGAFDLTTATGTFPMQTTWANDDSGGACEAGHPIVANPGSGENTVTVANPGAQSFTVGASASVQIRAADSDPSQTVTYRATGLPDGVSINPSTGLISGTASTTTPAESLVTVEAIDGTDAFGMTTFYWLISGSGTCSPLQLLGNPSFETGSLAPWQASNPSTVPYLIRKNYPAHTGLWMAWIDGYSQPPRTDTLSQTVYIPSKCVSATLSFWLDWVTLDPSSQLVDTFQVQVDDLNTGQVTTVGTLTNEDATGTYNKYSYSLSGFIGQWVTITYVATQNPSTSGNDFFDDDNLLTVF